MTVLSCNYAYGGRDAQIGIDDVSHVDQWIINTDDKTIHPHAAALAAQNIGPDKLPKIGDRHPFDARAQLKSLKIAPKSSEPSVLIAVGKYDRKFDHKKGDKEINPLNLPVIYNLERHQFQEIIQEDLQGKPLVNAVGTPFNPPIVQDDSRPILVATKNMQSLAAIVALQQTFKDAVNLGSFYGAAPRQAKVMSITAGSLQEKNGVSYYTVTIRIAFKGEGQTWDKRILNQGLTYREYQKTGNEYDTDPDTGERIFDTKNAIDGVKITEPKNLNELGELLEPYVKNPNGTFKLDENGDKIRQDAVYLSFRTYPERDFSQLKI